MKRGESAGPRGRTTGKSGAAVARLCCDKLDDSDASVRKSATETLSVLLSVEDEAISDAVLPIIESLKTKNSRVYKSLVKGRGGNTQRNGGVSNTASGPPARAASSGTRRTQTSPPSRKPPSQEAPEEISTTDDFAVCVKRKEYEARRSVNAELKQDCDQF